MLGWKILYLTTRVGYSTNVISGWSLSGIAKLLVRLEILAMPPLSL